MPAPAELRLTYEDIAGMMEHPVLRPELSEDEVRTGCEIARQYRIATVTVRPSDADLAVSWMRDSGVRVASVVSYPHGSQTTPVKLYETGDLLRRGVAEIDTVINLGKMISRQFQYVEAELKQMAEACHESGAILKVAFENGYLTDDLKTIACQIVQSAGADYARTSTPFGPSPYSLEDVALMKRLLDDRVKIKASGGVRTVADVLALREAGCARIGTISTVPILEDWKARIAHQKSQTGAA
ncbi:MAG: deoxyribose-phosphate aldolase [Bryobacteraceae bacterium]